MINKQLWTLASCLLIVGVLIPAAPSAAKSTKTPFETWDVACVTDPGIFWISDDGVFHGRGRVSQAVTYALDPASGGGIMAGSNTVIGNANFSLITGEGRSFGSFSSIFLLIDPGGQGTFEGTFNTRLSAFGTVFSGRAVGHGTGPLFGLKVKTDIESELAPPQWLVDLALTPPPCNPPLLEISHNTGFIHNPQGD